MRLCAKSASIFLLMAVASAAQPQQEPLGRLFFTPEQRAVLDRQRQLNQSGPVTDNAPITLNGRVIRSSGRNTTWINGLPLDEQEAHVLIRVPLRPGETSPRLDSDKHMDSLNGGSIEVKRGPERR